MYYQECLQLLEQTLLDSPLVAQLRAGVEMLPRAPSRQSLLVGALAS